MKPGISQLVLPALAFDDFFRQSAEAGYEIVELALKKEGMLSPEVFKKEVSKILHFSESYDLPIVSLVQDHCSGNLLASGESQERGIRESIEGLEIAAMLGAECTLHTLGRLSPDLYYDEAYKNGIAALKTIAEHAEKLKVAVAVEFVWNGFLFSPLEMKHFLDEIDSDYIGFYFDPGNMAIFQYPHHWVRIIGKRIKMVHAKDWNGNSLNGAWPALLKGKIDFKAVIQELRSAKYDGPIISEVPLSVAPLKETVQSIKQIISI